jgi:hypothetical protein
MKYYTIIKAYFKHTDPLRTLHITNCYITTDETKLCKRFEIEHNEMVKFINEIYGETPEIRQEAMRMHPDLPAGYSYRTSEITGYLVVTSTENLVTQNQDTLKIRDIVKFKPDAEAAIKESGSPYRALIGAKTAYISKISESRAVIRVIQSQYSENLERDYTVPLDYLIKVPL